MPEEIVRFTEIVMIAKDLMVPAILLISVATVLKLAFYKSR